MHEPTLTSALRLAVIALRRLPTHYSFKHARASSNSDSSSGGTISCRPELFHGIPCFQWPLLRPQTSQFIASLKATNCKMPALQESVNLLSDRVRPEGLLQRL